MTLATMTLPTRDSHSRRFSGRVARGAVALLAAAAMSSALAAGVGQGKEKFEQVCAACHGKDGNSPVDPSYPRLAGQYPDYTRQALRDYKTGARKNAIMGGIAKGLSNEDIDALAAYTANLKGSLHVRQEGSRVFR